MSFAELEELEFIGEKNCSIVNLSPDKTYKCVVDGFIVSDNIEVIQHYNVETKNGNLGYDGFAYSDHQPAYVEFKLL